jgi:hypothetical protein
MMDDVNMGLSRDLLDDFGSRLVFKAVYIVDDGAFVDLAWCDSGNFKYECCPW